MVGLIQKYDSHAIANAVLEKAWESEISLTKMQLIKIVYFVHGWSLAFFGNPLVEDRPQAWKLGPVYPRLYKTLAGYTSESVNRKIIHKDTDAPYATGLLPNNHEQLIDDVTNGYGKLHAFVLSEHTHEKGTPWDIAMKSKGIYSEIDDATLTKHFRDLMKKRNISPEHYNIN